MRGEFREVVEGFHAAVEDFGEVPSLWSTEFGYFGLAKDAKPFVPFKNPFVAREILSEEESAEAYIQAICTSFANGVDKTFISSYWREIYWIDGYMVVGPWPISWNQRLLPQL